MGLVLLVLFRLEAKYLILIPNICLFLAFGGCMRSDYVKEKVLGGNVFVSVAINKIKRLDNGRETYLYGTLTMVGKGDKIKSANLDCVSLGSTVINSKRLYVDSVAHILTSNYRADRDNQIKVDVYWLFNESLQDDDILKLDILINKAYPEWRGCIHFIDDRD